jgi:hypothetical protein
VTRKVSKPLSGKWRIVEMEVWDKNFLDMLEPAYIALDGKGSGKFLFGCVAHSFADMIRGITSKGISRSWASA